MLTAALDRLAWRWTVFTLVTMVLASAALAVLTAQSVETDLRPLMRMRAQIVADTARRDLSDAIAKGIPVTAYDVLAEYAADLAARDDFIASVEIVPVYDAPIFTPNPQVIRRQVAVPRVDATRDLALFVDVRLSAEAMGHHIQSTFFDIAMLTLAAMLFVLRVPFVLLRLGVFRPMQLTARVISARAASDLSVPRLFATWTPLLDRFLDRLDARKTALAVRLELFSEFAADPAPLQAFAREHGLGKRLRLVRPTNLDIGVPMFLIVFADALVIPIMPFYALEVADVGRAALTSLSVALPLSMGMLGFALTTLEPGWIRRLAGPRNRAVGAALLLGLGQIICALAGDPVMLGIGRVITGLGFGVVMAACGSYALAASGSGEARSAALRMMTITVIAAEVSGMVMGALLTDYVGHSVLFVVSAVMAAGAALTGYRLMRRYGLDQTEATSVGVHPMQHPLLRRGLILLVAPAGFVTGGIWLFVLPMHLSLAGLSNGDTARVVSLLSIAMLCFIPLLRIVLPRIGPPSLTNAVSLFLVGAGVWVLGRSADLAQTGLAVLLLIAGLVSIAARTSSYMQSLGTSGPDPVAPDRILSAQSLTGLIAAFSGPLVVNAAQIGPGTGFAAIAALIALAGAGLFFCRPTPFREHRGHHV